MSESPESPNLLTLQFLSWVASRPRNYADVMEAWRTSCPRMSIWEDALGAGLVQIDKAPRSPIATASVTLTARGKIALDLSQQTSHTPR
jgi:hypothetical protein